jgi:hypothetical protein
MPKEIESLSQTYLTDPVRVEVSPAGKAADKVYQSVHFVSQRAKADLLKKHLAEREEDLSLVFARTKHGAEKLMKHLVANGFSAASIHGNKSQGQRDRAIRDFRSGSTRILVATDVAARGIDIPGVSHVYNYDLPQVPESYVHRIGRTARAGAEGRAVSFCAEDEAKMLRDIEKLTGVSITVASGEHPGFGAGGRKESRGGRGRKGGGNGRPQGEKREARSSDNQNRKRPHRGKRPQGEQRRAGRAGSNRTVVAAFQPPEMAPQPQEPRGLIVSVSDVRDHRQTVPGLYQAGEMPRRQQPAAPRVVFDRFYARPVDRPDPRQAIALLHHVAEIGARLDHPVIGGEGETVVMRHVEIDDFARSGSPFRMPGMDQHVAQSLARDGDRFRRRRAAAAEFRRHEHLALRLDRRVVHPDIVDLAHRHRIGRVERLHRRDAGVLLHRIVEDMRGRERQEVERLAAGMEVENDIGMRHEGVVEIVGDLLVTVPSGLPGKLRLRLPLSIGEVRVPARNAG